MPGAETLSASEPYWMWAGEKLRATWCALVAVGMVTVGAFVVGTLTGAAEEKALPRMNRFVERMEQLLKTQYPDLKRSEQDGDTCLSSNTMTFMVHIPAKTGQWQKAFSELGPQRKGVLCRLRLVPGQYIGAAVLPQTFNHYYYLVYGTAPYSAKYDCHLHARLYYPEADTSADLLKHFSNLINDCERYLN